MKKKNINQFILIFSDKSDQLTVLRFIPEFNEAWACLCKEYFNVPGWNFFLGLKVLPLSKNELKLGKFIFWEWQIFQDSRKLDIRLFLIFLVSWQGGRNGAEIWNADAMRGFVYFSVGISVWQVNKKKMEIFM